jgi:hypothetical protein
VTHSSEASVLIFVSLFLAGGAYSFGRQGLPKVATAGLGVLAVLAFAAGIMRW